jgi:hypothetical protein
MSRGRIKAAGSVSEFVEKGTSPPAGHIPYSAHHAIKRKLMARIAALEAENAALRSRDGAATGKVAPRTVVCGGMTRPVIVLGQSKRHAETERDGSMFRSKRLLIIGLFAAFAGLICVVDIAPDPRYPDSVLATRITFGTETANAISIGVPGVGTVSVDEHGPKAEIKGVGSVSGAPPLNPIQTPRVQAEGNGEIARRVNEIGNVVSWPSKKIDQEVDKAWRNLCDGLEKKAADLYEKGLTLLKKSLLWGAVVLFALILIGSLIGGLVVAMVMKPKIRQGHA